MVSVLVMEEGEENAIHWSSEAKRSSLTINAGMNYHKLL